MSVTILFTGASSGIGEASATLFADRGWNVVATMRNNTDDGASLAGRDNVLVTTLDLLDSESVTAATDGTGQIRYISGDGAAHLLANRYSAEQDEQFVVGMRPGWRHRPWSAPSAAFLIPTRSPRSQLVASKAEELRLAGRSLHRACVLESLGWVWCEGQHPVAA